MKLHEGMNYVRWSEYTDRDGKKMIQIGVAHYPIDLCRDIARQILELLTARNDGTGSD